MVSTRSLTRTENRKQQERVELWRDQKQDFQDELDVNSMRPVDILERLADLDTPFASLLRAAAEEFAFSHAHARPQQVDALERDAAIEAAKKELEARRLTERLDQLANDGTGLRANLSRYEKRLLAINEDLERLIVLHQKTGIETEDPDPKTKRTLHEDDGIEIVHQIPLDDAKYKELWMENVTLQEKVEELKTRLKEAQVEQMVVFRQKCRDLLQRRGK